jgi:hypothetical protein
MGKLGLDPKPRLVVQPDSDPVTYHWHYPNDPIYVPHQDDPGFRWDLLEWTHNP